MQRQRTITVRNEKIKIVSRLTIDGFGVRTNINGKRYYHNYEIMLDREILKLGEKPFWNLFILRAMDRAFCKWVKAHTPSRECCKVYFK